MLVNYFLKQSADLSACQPSRELLDLLIGYNWPGNIRELQHCMRDWPRIERPAALNADGAFRSRISRRLFSTMWGHEPGTAIAGSGRKLWCSQPTSRAHARRPGTAGNRCGP